VLWELNRFRLGSHCKKRSCAKSRLLMLIDILLLSSSEVILTPDGQDHTVRKQFRRLHLIHAVASAARASSFKSACRKLYGCNQGAITLTEGYYERQNGRSAPLIFN